MNIPYKKLLTIRQAAEFLGVNPGTVRRWALGKMLKGIKVGSRGNWRFREEDLEKLIVLPHAEDGKKLYARKFAKIKRLLKENESAIQKLATTHHRQLLGDNLKPTEDILKYKGIHIKMVRAIANNLDNFEKGVKNFNILGQQIAEDAVKDNLTIEETVDGTIFLKDAIWKKLEETGLLKELTSQELYEFSQLIGNYCDILSSRIAFTYHNALTEKITASEGLFKALTQKSADAIALVDKKGKVLHASLSTESVMGYTPEEFKKLSNPFELVPETERKFVTKLFQKLLKKPGSTERAKYKIMHKGGYTIWVASVMTNLIENEQINAVVINYSDINDSVETEQKLKRSEERLNTLILASSDVVFGMNADWSLMQPIKGRTLVKTSAIPQKNWMEQNIPTSEHKRVMSIIKKAIKQKSVFEIEHQIKRANGSLGWTFSRAVPILDKNGAIIEWFGSASDITEQKELELQKDNFLGIVSHELKTPVTSIKAYTQVLQTMFEAKGDSSSAGLLGKMDSQVDRLNNLITDLLDVTNIQSGKMKFNRVYFDFNQLVTETIEDVQRISLDHTIVTKLTASKNVYGDKERVGQVLTNYITNAIKYSPDANKIIVSTKSDGKTITLYVQDFGIGIPRVNRNKIFEQSFRVRGSGKDTFPGLGLGLYISSEIIKREGGEIGIKSSGKKGSVFYFTLPIKVPEIKKHPNSKVSEKASKI